MGLVPGEDRSIEAPPNQTGRVWFLRACVGLAFTLWSGALAQPLGEVRYKGYSDAVITQTNQVYPIATHPEHHVMPLLSWFVSGTFLAVIAAGVAVGTLTFEDESARSLGHVLSRVVGGWCAVSGFFSFIAVFWADPKKPGDFERFVPFAGAWLIWVALALLVIPANQVFTIEKKASASG